MSKADEMFLKTDFVNKEEIIQKGKLTKIKYEDENCRYSIIFNIISKEIRINAVLNLKELQAINEKCKELKWI